MIGRTGGSYRKLYSYPYNLRIKLGFRKNYVRKCTEKCYGIFPQDGLY